jgi:L-ascorbate metabolism protein UlaG (beta-lactamase superfamily)
MVRPLEIVFIANGGLLIQSPQAKVLIDGIFQLKTIKEKKHSMHQLDADDIFSTIPEDILDRIINGREEFGDIDALLFTHFHKDHFNREKTIECLRKNPVGKIFMPEGMVSVKNQAAESGTEVVILNLPFGVTEQKMVKDMRIQYFRAAHSGAQYSQVEHYCFLISVGDTHIYISADADFTKLYQHTMLESEEVTVGFFNPLCFHAQSGRELIKRINPKRVIMYHVPLATEDKYAFRERSEKVVNHFRDRLPPCDIVSEVLQKFYIG